ncbi:MAG: GNAT family N-acetyltransferase [Bacillota bacterium]
MGWQIRQATLEDMSQVAALFLDSFRETIVHLFGEGMPEKGIPGGEALKDFFSFLLKEEQGAFWVAREKEADTDEQADRADTIKKLLGYIVVSADLTYLWRRAVLGGYVFYWLNKYLRGAYGVVNLSVVWQIIRNKFGFFRHSRSMPQYESQILSFAVAENYRGQGLSGALLKKGLTYLEGRGKQHIKLEVRPWNKAALQLYLKHGFTPAGTTRDSQGEWLVMVKRGFES